MMRVSSRFWRRWPARVGVSALVVILLDWGTQFWVSHVLVLGQQIGSGGPVKIHYITDGGAGIFPVAPWLTPLVVVALLIAAAIHFRHQLASFSWWVQIAVGVAAGGWLGNTLEAFALGHIVDFLQLWLGTLWILSPADAAIWVGGAVAGGSLLARRLRQWLPHTKGWAERASAVTAVGVVATGIAAATFLCASSSSAGGLYSTPAIATSAAAQITAIASASGSRTLAIRGGKVEWLSPNPTRWTPVTLPTRFNPPIVRLMYPTAVAVTSSGLGLVGMSDGVVLAISPNSPQAADVVADYLLSPVVTLAGMGTMGHLEMLISTSGGTYSVGLKGPLAVWWPHKEASAVVAPANSEGTWAAVVDGRLRWASAAVTQGGVGWNPGTWLRFWTANLTLVQVWRPGWWASAWSQASSRTLGPHAFLTERPGGTVAVATQSGVVLTGAPGEGLSAVMHTVATSPLGLAAKPTGLVSTQFPTPGNVFVLAAGNDPLLVDGYPGWEALGGPTTNNVRLVADIGGTVVEALATGGVKAVAVNPTVGSVPSPGRAVPGWVGPSLGFAVLLALLVLAGFAAWRLPWRPRVAVFTAAGVVMFGIGGVAVGRFVLPTAARYTRSQVRQAWLNGTYAASVGSWLITPSQCEVLATAVGWKDLSLPHSRPQWRSTARARRYPRVSCRQGRAWPRASRQ